MLSKLLGKEQEFKDFQYVYHTGTIVNGKEYYYGGSMDQNVTGGIDNSFPSQTPYGTPIKQLSIGNTNKTQQQIDEFIEQMNSSDFMANKYEALQHNCNTFTDAFIFFLTGNHLDEEYKDQGLRFKKTSLGPIYEKIMSGNMNLMDVAQLFNPMAQAQIPQVSAVNQAIKNTQQQPQQPQQQNQPTQHKQIEIVDQKYESLYIEYPKIFFNNKDATMKLIENTPLQSVFDAYNNAQDILLQPEALTTYIQNYHPSTIQLLQIYSLLSTTSSFILIPKSETPISLILQKRSEINHIEFLEYLANYLSTIAGMIEARTNYQPLFNYIKSSTKLSPQFSFRCLLNFVRILTAKQIKELNLFDYLIQPINSFTQQIIQGNQKPQLACLNLLCACYGRSILTCGGDEEKVKVNQCLIPLKETRAPAVKQLLEFCKIVQIQNLDEFY